MSPKREFTREDLKVHNAKDQPTVYVAHEGKVYDVSQSKLWKTGTHMKRHAGGTDLSGELKAAPHGPEVFARVAEAGVMKAERDPMDEKVPEFLLQLFARVPMLRRHPHPMTVHFPIAFCMAVPLFNLLYLFTGEVSFEGTAFHLLVLGILGMAVSMMTGPYTWWLNYGARMNQNIAVKMGASSLLFLLLLAGFFWRLSRPELLVAADGPSWGYFLLTCSYPALVTVLGWFGAKMTFPS